MARFIASMAVVAALATSAVAQTSNSSTTNTGTQSAANGLGQPPVGPAVPPPNALFAAIDADGDGVITKAELRKAVAALRKFDADKDGKITLEETMHNVDNPGTTGMNVQGNFGGQRGFNNGNNGGGYGGVANDPRSGPDMTQYDRNRDGSVTADEVPPQLRGMVRGSDQNGNGKLDPLELAVIRQRMDERARGQRALPPGVTAGPGGVQRNQ